MPKLPSLALFYLGNKQQEMGMSILGISYIEATLCKLYEISIILDVYMQN